MEINTDKQQLTRLSNLIKTQRTDTTPGMMASHNNIKKNLDIINTLFDCNNTVPSDFPTIKNALLSNQHQIRGFQLCPQGDIASMSSVSVLWAEPCL